MCVFDRASVYKEYYDKMVREHKESETYVIFHIHSCIDSLEGLYAAKRSVSRNQKLEGLALEKLNDRFEQMIERYEVKLEASSDAYNYCAKHGTD